MSNRRGRPRVADTIVARIETMIVDGTLKPGARLPGERELAQKLDVSRASLREALVFLESRGLVQVRRGGGTFVTDVVAQTITDPLVHLMKSYPETTFDVLELRHALEEVAACYAAQRASDADRANIRRRFEALDAVHGASDTGREALADTEFHLAIAEASHNLALVHVMRGLFNLLRIDSARNFERIRTDAENHEIIRRQHREIFAAVLERDPEAAREAAHHHLAFVGATVRAALQEPAPGERGANRRADAAEPG